MLAGVAVVTLAAGFLYLARRRRAQDILTQYGVQTPEELTALAQSYRERCQAADKAAHEVEVIQTAVTERQNKRDSTKAALLDFVHAFAPEVTDLFGCSAALSRALNIDHDLALARERAAAARRRLDDLAAQGAERQDGPIPELPIPDLGPEDTQRLLERTAGRLEQVSALSARSMPDGHATISMVVEVKDKRELEGVINKLNNIQGVYHVARASGK